MPFIIPIVFYNGLKPWVGQDRGTLNLNGDVCFKLQNLYAKNAPTGFYTHSLQLTWFLISVHDMPIARLQKHDHVVSWLMQYERLSPKSRALVEVSQKISQYLAQAENHWLRKPVEWLREYVILRLAKLLKSKKPPHLNDISEETMKSWKEIMTAPEEDLNQPESFVRYFYEESEKCVNKGLSQGLSQGREQALKEAVALVLKTRFGAEGKKLFVEQLQNQEAMNWQDLLNQAVVSKSLQNFAGHYLKS